jgi:outer membrane lipoprotein carrier protein
MAALRSVTAALSAVSLAGLIAVHPSGAETTAPELARALQKKYDAIKDFSADFVHVYEGGVLKKQITERGHVIVKKPGKMRWDYTAPVQKVFVSDGVKLYSYLPQEKQVFVTSVPQGDQATTPTLFLTGKGDLIRDFTPSLVELPPALPAGTQALKLVPKAPQREYDWLILAVDPASLAIRGLVTVDAQGGKSSFSFTNLKENVGLADKDFTFKIPHGVDVVTDSPRR